MKDWRILDLKDFLEIADTIDTPFKFLEIEDDTIHAVIWLRTALISYVGDKEKLSIEKLKEHGFKVAKELETKRIVLEDLL